MDPTKREIDLRCNESLEDMDRIDARDRNTHRREETQVCYSSAIPTLRHLVLPPAHSPIVSTMPPVSLARPRLVNYSPQKPSQPINVNVAQPLCGPTLMHSGTGKPLPRFRATGLGSTGCVTVPVTSHSIHRTTPAFVPISTVNQVVSPYKPRPVSKGPLVYPSTQPTFGPSSSYVTQPIVKTPSAPGTPNREGTPQTPNQSPRPSILRKRHSELHRETPHPTSPAARKLVYEPANLKLGSGCPENNGKEIEEDTKNVREESPTEERSVSNQSTASTGSTLSASGSTGNVNSNEVELSPRKRPRKQAFDPKPQMDDTVHYTRITDENVTQNGGVKRSLKADVCSTPEPTEDLLGRGTPDTMLDDEATMTPPTDDALSDGEAEAMFPLTHNGSQSPPPLISQRKMVTPKRKDDHKSDVCNANKGDTPVFRPRPSLLAGFKLKYLPRKNHFKKPEMVKNTREVESGGKRSRRGKGSVEESGGKKVNDTWKVDRVVMQLDDVSCYEADNLIHINSIAKNIAQGDHLDQKDADIIEEMALTSGQRNKALVDMVAEIKGGIGAIKQHTYNSKSMLNKYCGKRNNRKRHEPSVS